MRKIYSLVLMATALLIGTNAWADTLAELQAVFTNGGDYTLTEDVVVKSPLQMYAKSTETGKTVNLNLNGKTISTTSAKAIIELYKGTLNITGPGRIVTTAKSEAIKVFGYTEDVPDCADWSVLNIGDGVSVESTGTSGANAISVLGFYGAKYYAYVTKEHAGEVFDGEGGRLNYIGDTNYETLKDADYVYKGAKTTCTDKSGTPNALYTSGKIDYYTSWPKASAVKSQVVGSETIEWCSIGENSKAFGVKINVMAGAFVYGDKYGIKINGTIRSNGTNIPTVHIANGAEVKAAAEAPEATAVYSSGYGKFVIEGYVHGSTGVYVKAGQVSVEDGAKIQSDNNTGDGIEAINKGSGINAGGNAIAIEGDNGAYSNEGISVEVNGGTIIAGEGGYAVQNLNNAETQANPNAVEINGGTFTGGAAGSVAIDNASGKVVNVDLEGGTFTGDIETLIAAAGAGNVIQEVVAQEGGQATVVIGKKEAGDEVEQPDTPQEKEEFVFANDMSNDIVKLDATTANIAKTLPAGETVVKYLSLTGTGAYTSTVTVEAGKTLKVGQIVMNANGRLIVEAGAKLIVTGANGIFADDIENLVLKTSEGNPSIFLLNPEVANNRHPKATVELTSKSYRESGKNVYQRFGIPSYTNDVRMEYKDPSSSTTTYIQMWDYSADKWTESWIAVPAATGLNVGVSGPFGCFDLASNNAKNAPMTYLFKGALVGNSDATMAFNSKFNPYANSYMAPIDIKTLVNRLADNYPELSAAVYVYVALANDNYTWLPLAQSDFTGWDVPAVTKIDPMQAYMLYMIPGNTSNATVSYKDNVYDPFITNASNPAPAHRAKAAKKNFLKLNIADESGVVFDNARILEDNQFGEEFDNGYDVNKYMNEKVNLYVMSQDEAWSTLASDDVLNKYIGVNVAQSGVYTISVAHNGLDYALVDLENNQVIDLVEGNTYNFFQEAGKNDARFQVVKVSKVPTALEDVQNDVLSTKFMKDGVLYIIKNGVVYNAQGQIVK